MAMVKCLMHGRPVGSKRSYVKMVLPIAYPNAAVICNAAHCDQPGQVWLDTNEAHDYADGQRAFSAVTDAGKYGVQ